MPNHHTILFAGGGSLGHLIPSMAVETELRNIAPEVKSVFVCADRFEEIDLLTKRAETFHVLRAPKFPRGMALSFFTFPFHFFFACRF